MMPLTDSVEVRILRATVQVPLMAEVVTAPHAELTVKRQKRNMCRLCKRQLPRPGMSAETSNRK
jgi:hypothetical protein